MIARLKLKPGQKGTKALTEKFGDDLVCVRYRYDAATRTRIKTVELVIDRKELPPQTSKISDDATVAVQIAYGERNLGRIARAAGGRWDPDVRLWYIRYGRIKGSELEQYIILDARDKNGSRKSI